MTDQYEVIDCFSANGLYRGLLVANHSRHDVLPAPPLFHASPTPVSVRSTATAKDRVFGALTREYQDMPALVRKTGYCTKSIRAALRNLVSQGFAEVRRVDAASAFQGSQIKAQWCRRELR